MVPPRLWTLENMVPLVSFLAALRILTEAQTCNNGVGKLVYEKIADYKLSAGFGGGRQRVELITRADQPIKVLEECVRRCQEDRTTAVTQCLSFDFMPGRRRPSHVSTTTVANALGPPTSPVEFEESVCYLYFDRAAPDGGETLVRQNNAWHFNEVCLTSGKVASECASRLYVFDRTPGYRLESLGDKEIFASNRTECEDRCLGEFAFVCRSCSYDRAGQRCRLSTETKYMSPAGFKPDSNSDYMENLCLPSSQMCTTTAFILEAGKELDGAFEREVVPVRDLTECSNYCSRSLAERGFFCRSFLYDDKSRSCTLYDEDPLGFGEGSEGSHKPLKASSGDLYRVLCGTSERGAVIGNATFECYRRKRLDGSHQVEVKSYSFQECLDECTRRYGRDCKSVEFSSKYQSCRFSSYDAAGSRRTLIDDDYYDFYEFKWHRSAGHVGAVGGHVGPPFGPPQGPAISQGPHGHAPHGQQPYYPHHIPAPGPGPWSPTQSPYGGYGGGWQATHRGYPPSQSGYGQGRWPSISNAGTWPPGGGAYGRGGGPPSTSYVPSSGYGGSGSYGGAWNSPTGYGTGYSGTTGYAGTPYAPGGGFAHQALPPAGVPPIVVPGAPVPPGLADKCKPAGGAFRRVGYGTRLRSFYIRRVVRVERLEECEAACIEARDIQCKSFNFRAFFPDNCELSDYDSRQLQLSNPSHFDQSTNFDYFERDDLGAPGAGTSGDCLDVSQACTPDGMEFTLRTVEGFFGRIYTYGFYDSCFYDGNGGSVNVLRISRANGFPRCGTQQYGDVMTNIVVVQFNDYVQTSRDKKYNLTCYFSGPGEAVVTSNYLDTRTDGRYPTQIEHLPAQNILTSNVQLRILYRGTPTTTIAVGDLLTFRLEARGKFQFDFYSDIFASNVIAKDPYSGRQVHLIDSRGCPVDLYVFPELHKAPDGALEAEFYAFKIPDSNLLVFQATVRTCRGPCEPVICSDRGRPGTFPSWGRRKRAALGDSQTVSMPSMKMAKNGTKTLPANPKPKNKTANANSTDSDDEEPEEVHELLTVYLSRADIPSEGPQASVYKKPQVCVAQTGYYALVTMVALLLCMLVAVSMGFMSVVRRQKLQMKVAGAAMTSPLFMGPSTFQAPISTPATIHNPLIATSGPSPFDDPSEPIYTDPSMFERSRSLRSLTVTNSHSKPTLKPDYD